jgi:hypothetical protein
MSVLELVPKLTNMLPTRMIVKYAQEDLYMMMEPLPKDVPLTLKKELDLSITLGMRNLPMNTLLTEIKLMILKKCLSQFGSDSKLLTPPSSISVPGVKIPLELEDSLLTKDKFLFL